ncbi:nuclear transport factor 2 family protein [Ferruginibacter sp.]|nr:nuclear transport factor 2 family protein [Ferruginibacter sp.]
MKALFFATLFICHFTCFAQTADEAKLIETVKEFHQALVKKNTISLNQQTDKALSYGHSNGWIQSKKDLVKDFERGYISYQSFKEDSITVLMNDNIANVRFVADITATLGGTTVVNNYHLKVLEVWVKKGKRWVLFARQAVKG